MINTKKIMFVCHGNICRSPMAEFIFKKMVNDAGLSDKFYIVSRATSTEEIWNGVGNPVYPPARAELEGRGYLCDGKRAEQVKASDYDEYDMLICMDDNNVRNLLRIVKDDKDGKISKLMDYTSRGGDVADPWYYGNFDVTFDDIYEGCAALFKKIAGE